MAILGRFALTLELTAFIDARIVNAPDTDDPYERGVFIPLDINDLKVTPTGKVFGDADVLKIKVQNPQHTHIVKHRVSAEVEKKLDYLGRQVGIIGKIGYDLDNKYHFVCEENKLKYKLDGEL